jgi:5-methylcytosine-specific restriction endonuclease McrA
MVCVCGKPFEPTHGRQKYCSRRCNHNDYYSNHREKRKEQQGNYSNTSSAKQRNVEYRQRVKDKVFALYGNSCAYCGSTDKLSLDHKNGDGNADRGSYKSAGTHYYRKLLKQERREDIQVLCIHCNMAKGQMTEDQFDQWFHRLAKNKYGIG